VSTKADRPDLAGYRPSPWPGEDGGPRRTASPARVDPSVTSPNRFGELVRAGGSLEVTARHGFMFTMPVLRDPGEVYLHGCELGTPSTGWVERIDPITLATIERSPALAGGPFWPGGVAAHANGDLYTTFGRWCHRLAPDCSVVASRELPRDRPYNSLIVLPSGHLVMKDFAGGTGINRIDPASGRTGSELVVLDPDSLGVVAQLELAEGSIARLSADVADDGTVYVYVVGDTHLFRVVWNAAAVTLAVDDSFTCRYRTLDGQTFGWDVVLAGGSAWFLDNGEGTEDFGGSFRDKGLSGPSPLHLVRIPLTAGRVELWPVCGERGGIIANPPAIDAARRIAVGYDSSHGVLSAWRYGHAAEVIEPEPLWQRQQFHAGHLVAFDGGELVTYDYDHDAGTDQVVVLDIESGTELARVATGSPVQSVVFPGVGWHDDVYVTTFSTFARVAVAS
jgi:hypothetical protein